MTALMAIVLPMVLSLVALSRRTSMPVIQMLVLAGILPSLLIAVWGVESASFHWLILQAHFGIDGVRQVFLLFTALLWLVSGLYAGSYLDHDPRRHGFFFFYLLTMSGNVGLLLAEDVASFYTLFALMTFAAFGLVVHERTVEAKRAARVYIVMAVMGEAFILAAIFMTAAGGGFLLEDAGAVIADSPNRDVLMLAAFCGFGVKAGAFLLHLWLPLAHPVAPTPASAILSGAMIKAGLVGWIHFLPLGDVALSGWSSFVIMAGVTAAFYAVLVGITQQDPKTNLAYSSISQMGLMTIAIGIGLAQPDAWEPAAGVLVIYAMSHGFAKGTLFLGVGVAAAAGESRWKRRFVLVGLFGAAIAIAGAPLTGGAIAKKALTNVAGWAPSPWPVLLDWVLPLSAVGTTLLLGHFLFLIWKKMAAHEELEKKQYHVSIWWAWIFGFAMAAVGVWLVVPFYALGVELAWLRPGDVWDGIWPLAVGGSLLWFFWRAYRIEDLPFRLPAGDVLVGVEYAVTWMRNVFGRMRFLTPAAWAINFVPIVERLLERERRLQLMERAERLLVQWRVAGVLFLLLIAGFFILLML